ncbi:MAG: J domain-containing protein [Rhabdochlamydiaceae bacterium]
MSIESFYYPKLTTLPDAWQRSSFTGISALWILSNNSYLSSNYKIRKIADLGSINDSILHSGIDLFDRQIEVKKIDNRLLDKIKRVLIYLGIFIFAPPAGCIWHLGNCIYHIVVWIKKGEKHSHFKEHVLSVINDLAWTACTCVVAYDLLKSEKFSLRLVFSFERMDDSIQVIALMLYSFVLPFALLSARTVFYDIFTQAFQKPYILKQRFGVVGENEWLLSFKSKVDRESCSIREKPDTLQLSGYFCDLRKEQAVKLLMEVRKIIQCLQLRLEEEPLKEFSEDPKKFLQTLQNSSNLSTLSRTTIDTNELKQSVDHLKKYLDGYKEIENILSDFFSSIHFPNFFFDPESCRTFFTYQDNESNLSLLDNFNDLLTQIKHLKWSEGAPSNSFTGIKQNILSANDAYEVLGLKAGASKEACKTAYIKSVIQIHPDKTPETWKAQATELFKVVDTAYRYINSV